MLRQPLSGIPFKVFALQAAAFSELGTFLLAAGIARGARLLGRVLGFDGHVVSISPDLDDSLGFGDEFLRELLGRIDELVRGVYVGAVAAYNTSKRDPDGNVFHPRDAGWVGYEINLFGERLYHSGDTDVIPEMDRVTGVDVALLPVSGIYVMTAQEAAEAARRIQPRVAVPMHWGSHIGTADAREFAEKAPVEVRILEQAAA